MAGIIRIHRKLFNTIFHFVLLPLPLLFVLLSACENPVQDFIGTNLFGPAYNIEVKKLAQTEAVNYGFSVATYGDYIMVGAPANHSNMAATESAYIYHKTGPDKWEGPFSLPQPSDYTIGDRFGYSVSIYGDFAAVAAPNQTVSGYANSGAVYIYLRKNGTVNEWAMVKKLTKEDQTSDYFYSIAGDEMFGYAIKLYDNRLIIGAPYDDRNGTYEDAGIVYVFKYDGINSIFDRVFIPNTQVAKADFGISIDINASYAVIGAPREDVSDNYRAGAVYIYSFNSGKFEFKEKIPNANYTGDDDFFGGSVSISGDFLAVGAGGIIVDSIFLAGEVFVYQIQAGSWNTSTPAAIALSEPAAYDYFGYPVAIRADSVGNYTLTAGCVDRDFDADTPDMGAVFIYTNETGTNNWNLQKTLTPSDGSKSTYFGRSIALGDNYAVIGACHLYDYFTDGGVYIFR